MNASLVKQALNLASRPKSNPSLMRDRFLPVSSPSIVEDILMREAAEQFIQYAGILMLKDVRFLIEDDVMMLLGSVPSYYMKQVLQTAVMKAVKDLELDFQVENHCQVVYVSNEYTIF